MDEFEFDKTRKAIGADELDEEERKKLFQRFREKGGQVLKENIVKKNLENEAKLRSPKIIQEERKLPSQIYREEKLKEAERIAREKVKREAILKKASSPMAIFSLKMQLWLKGITFFNKDYLKPSFLSFLNLEFKKSILECNILATEFLSDPKFLEVFKKSYTPLYLELLKRVYLLYDRKQLSDLTSSYTNSGDILTIDLIRIPVFAFLRKLYVIQPFRELTLKLLLDCIDIQQNLQKKQPTLYKNKKKRIQESWYILMDKTYPRFVLIAQYLERKKLEPFTDLFEEMIGINLEDKIDPNKLQDFKDVKLEALGNIGNTSKEAVQKKVEAQNNQNNIKEKENSQTNTQEESEEEKKERIHNKIYQFGLRFINLYPIEKLKQMYDPKDEFKNISYRDKLFLSYLLLNFFDDQFGFIFLTNKIQINSFIRNGVRVSLKDDMSILYETFRKIYEYFRKYYEDYNEYLNIKNDEFADKNSLDYQKKLDYYEKRRIKSAKEAYKAMLNYIKKCEHILLILFKDLRDKHQYILNPEDIIELEYDESKRKLMHKKKIKEIIRDAYATAYTIAYKMEQGELSIGDLELTEEEFQFHYGNIV
ncbi:MAG: hypothetical protein KatS3mg129_1169 [Leptospiraceae bacterium]|nr:MAG: hypothetical protein KatS3mg129_1169 [Leptospiraceae bacterium]